MRIPSTNVSHNKLNVKNGQKGPKVSGTPFLGKTKNVSSSSPKKSVDSSLPISKKELMQLAVDYKSGVINKKEANSRFVSAVINNSIQSELGEKDRQKITDHIEKFFSGDPEFFKKLSENLDDLA